MADKNSKARQLIELWREILFLSYKTKLIEKIDRFDLTFIQRNVIIYVARHKRIGMSELGRMLSLKGPALTRITDVLEKKKLLKRIRIPGDRRGYSLTVTDSCRKILGEIENLPAKVFTKVAKRCTEEEFNAVFTGAQLMLKKMEHL